MPELSSETRGPWSDSGKSPHRGVAWLSWFFPLHSRSPPFSVLWLLPSLPLPLFQSGWVSLLLFICVNCRRCCREVSSPHGGPQASFLVQCLLVLASKGDIWGHWETLKFLEQSVSWWPFLMAPNFFLLMLPQKPVQWRLSSPLPIHFLSFWWTMLSGFWFRNQGSTGYMHTCVHVCAYI